MGELRATLNVLKESAGSEETRAFDPSGTSTQPESSTNGDSPERATSWHGPTSTADTEFTGTSPYPAWSADAEREQQQVEDALDALTVRERTGSELTEAEKLDLLESMFPTIKAFDRAYTLKKAGSNFDKAVEVLLNQAFFEEEGANDGLSYNTRGIEGFADIDSGQARRGRKAKGKRKKQTRRTSSTPAVEHTASTPSPRSRWDQAKEDVDYLAERTHLPRKSISSIYHESGASLPTALIAMCASTESVACNPFLPFASVSILEAHASELAVDFPSLSPTHAEALVRMTHPSTASAHELAKAMLFSSGPSDSSGIIVPQYLPRPPSPSLSSFENTFSHLPLPDQSALNLATARSNALAQASAAYRKSKSKPLMGGAAAYYSSVGRDAAAALARHEAAVADALVAGQSNTNETDLHGVNVKDAVRITRAKVQAWWDGGAAEWARHGKVQGHGGFRVVTGLGRHSSGGKSRLGPAVGAMLVREGWKVEVGDGVVLVKGRARR